MEYAVEVENLFFRYKEGNEALNGISFKVKPGEKVAILGENGAGKTTLLLHLNAVYLPQKGKIKIFGEEIKKGNEYKIRKTVGLVFQNPDDQVFSSTVYEDIAFGPANFGIKENELSKRVEKAMKALDIEDLKERIPYHLSFGQKKKVAIAGVLAVNPEILVLDEPMAYLDPKSKLQIKKVLEDLEHENRTLIIATHDVDFAAEWAERVIILKLGRVFAEGDPELLTKEDIIKEAGLDFPVVYKFSREIFENKSPLPYKSEDFVNLIKLLINRP